MKVVAVWDTSVRTFVSYARADRQQLERFCTYAADLRHDGVEFFDDRGIPPGSDFENTLLTQLDDADIVVLLLTPNFIASDWCMQYEFARAVKNMIEGKCRILPLNVERFYVKPQSTLGKMQWTPSGQAIAERNPKERGQAWINAAWELNRCVEAVRGRQDGSSHDEEPISGSSGTNRASSNAAPQVVKLLDAERPIDTTGIRQSPDALGNEAIGLAAGTTDTTPRYLIPAICVIVIALSLIATMLLVSRT